MIKRKPTYIQIDEDKRKALDTFKLHFEPLVDNGKKR